MRQQADAVVSLYLTGVELGQPVTREQKESIESIIAADYDGRSVVELLQNGHDAHDPTRSDGRLEFFLDETEGEHGVLYAANGGRPLDEDNFDSMCRIGLSSKRPDEGIGNKGVGFKSVLQLTDCPEVFSASGEGTGRFDGFRFRFGRPSDFDDLAARSGADREGLADELRENVSTLKVTVPLAQTSAVVDELAQRGFSTVIRLPLRSAVACGHAREQLEEIAHDDVPFHLFLVRVAEIVVRVRDTVSERTQRLTRTTRPRQGTDTLSVEQVALGEKGEYLVFKRLVAEGAMQAAIQASREENAIGSSWAGWKGDGEVSVAVPLGAPLKEGRVYAFLPLGEDARRPLAALVNGPFFARLDRRDVHEAVPLNDVLFNEVAALCADAVIAACRGELDLPDGVRLDLVCWSQSWLGRLTTALEARGFPLGDLPVIPALAGSEGLTVTSGLLWSRGGAVFTPEAVAAAGETRLMRYDLHERHIQRLRLLFRACAVPIDAQPKHLAEFAETLAADLLARGATPDTWADFYDDLSVALPTATVLQGRRVILTEDGMLHAGGEDDDLTIYFSRVRSEGGDLPPLPDVVRDRLAFMPGDIRWVDEDRKQRPGRRWLEAMVREYRTDAVLDLLGTVMQDTEDDEIRSACLRFAFNLWRDTPAERRANAVGQAGLLVLTHAGWYRPSDAYFGIGWGGPDSKTDRRLADLVNAAAPVSEALKVIGRQMLARSVLRDEPIDDARQFFETLGVNHGLVPRRIPAMRFQLRGRQLRDPRSIPPLSIGINVATQTAWRELAAERASKPSYETTRYQPTGGIAFLPGQQDWAAFNDDARRLYAQLVLRGLGVWSDSALQVSFRASTDPVTVVWPTFVSVFLTQADWVLQTTPGERSKQTFAPLRSAWWVGDIDTPDYLPADPAAWRSLLTERARTRLKELGARFWDDPATAASRLLEINTIVTRQGPRTLAVRSAYEQAWRDLLDTDGQVPHEVLVTVQGALGVVDLDKEGVAVYARDRRGETKDTLLAQTPVPMLAVRAPVLADQVRQALVQDGVTRIRSCSDADVTILVDGTDALEVPGQPLARWGGDWAPLLIDAVAEQRRHTVPVSGVTATSAVDPLRGNVQLVLADVITPIVDGHRVDQEFAPESMVVTSSAGDPVIVVRCGSSDRWSVLQAAAAALAEFRGGLAIADSLRLALIDLARRCGDETPTPADIAAVLKMPVAEMHALVDHGALSRFELTPVLELLACLDLNAAEELQGTQTAITSRDEVRSWLADHDFNVDQILDLASRNDLLDATRQLGISLSQANTGLRALNLTLLHNVIGHRQQFDAYVQQHQSKIRDRLRDRFMAPFWRGAPLDEYVRLRELPGLKPDVGWLDTHWNLSHEVLEAHIDSWVKGVGEPLGPGQLLPPVDQLRERGRRAVSRKLERAWVVVEAWLHRYAGGQGKRPADPAGNIEKMIQAGLMDFQVPRTDAVIGWLQEHEQWPEGMPPTTELRQLQLENRDIDGARSRLETQHDTVKRDNETIRYSGKTYSTDPEDRDNLIQVLREHIPQQVLETNPTPVAIVPLPAMIPADKAGHGSAGAWRVPTISTDKTKLIGLAGEIVVGEWLRATFGLPPEDTWCSGYRADYLADGQGNDTLGYDFLVKRPDKTLLYEVKATAENTPQFTLGESEVRRANSLTPDEEYHIVFVTHVLDPDKLHLRILPNPLAPGGLASYQVVGRSLHLRFMAAD